MESDFISTNIDDFGWSQPRFGSTGEPRKLRELSSEELFREAPATVEARSGIVNWVARNLEGGESIAYNIKGVADRRVVEALGETILALCKRHDTPIFNIKIGFESAGVVNDNRLRNEGARSQPAAADSQTAAPAQAHPISVPAPGVSVPTPAASAYPTSAPTALAPPSSVAGARAMPSAITNLPCPNCHWPGHELRYCPYPSLSHGSIAGCPECNVGSHNLDNCPVSRLLPIPRTFRLLPSDFLELVYQQRRNKPQIHSERHLFFDEVHAINKRHRIDPAELNKPRVWPWTNAFAIQVAKANPGDPILGGKLHPDEWNRFKHSYRDLPEDPALRGRSINDIIRMRHQGFFDAERPTPDVARMREAEPDMQT